MLALQMARFNLATMLWKGLTSEQDLAVARLEVDGLACQRTALHYLHTHKSLSFSS